MAEVLNEGEMALLNLVDERVRLFIAGKDNRAILHRDIAQLAGMVRRLIAEVERGRAEVTRLQRIIHDSFCYLPKVGTMAFADFLLTPHAVAVADEFAVLQAQVRAFEAADTASAARKGDK